MYIYNSKLYTLQQVLRQITAKLDSSLAEELSVDQIIQMTQTSQLMKYAVVVVACIPLILAYPFVRRFFIKGIMVGSVKG